MERPENKDREIEGRRRRLFPNTITLRLTVTMGAKCEIGLQKMLTGAHKTRPQQLF